MIKTVAPFQIAGRLCAISSKSEAHRLLIASALAPGETFVSCRGTSRDIQATVDCLNALGADIRYVPKGFQVKGLAAAPRGDAVLPVGESGSTYRFLTPVACALGVRAKFQLTGRLPQRPMEGLFDALRENGGAVSGTGTNCPILSGPLKPGRYRVPADVSSQFISGLLFALPLLDGDSEIVLEGELASAGYVDMTRDALARFGVSTQCTETGYRVTRGSYRSFGDVAAGGDWSNAAFLLAAAAVNGRVTLSGLSKTSLQGDRAMADILRSFGAQVDQRPDEISVTGTLLRAVTLNVSHIPDLVPAIAVCAASAQGDTVLTGAARLALKESDRLNGVTATLLALGGRAEHTKDTIVIHGTGGVVGGRVSSLGDHRIAMMAAALAANARRPIQIDGAEDVGKSYPAFFEDLGALGVKVTEEGNV